MERYIKESRVVSSFNANPMNLDEYIKQLSKIKYNTHKHMTTHTHTNTQRNKQTNI